MRALDTLLWMASMPDVFRALGGELKRSGRAWRGRAFWRDSDSFNIRVTERSCKCFVTGQTFTILALIETVLGCSRGEALGWLARFYGVTLERQKPADTRSWVRRRENAERIAENLTGWRTERLLALRKERNRLYRSEGIASAAARTLLANPGPDDEAAWEAIWQAVQDDLRGDAIQAEIDALLEASPADLLAMKEAA